MLRLFNLLLKGGEKQRRSFLQLYHNNNYSSLQQTLKNKKYITFYKFAIFSSISLTFAYFYDKINDCYSQLTKFSSEFFDLFVYDDGDGDHYGYEKATNTHNTYSPIIEKGIKIQQLLSEIGNPFKFPNIVVVGTQSCGKSSLLESIIGFSFLPKGNSKMVTKRPIEISLINSVGPLKIYLEDEEIVSIPLLRKKLFLLNEEGPVSMTPIHVTLSSPDLPTLSLIDLPGLIELNSESESLDLPEKIKEIYYHYLRDNDNIILSLTPSTIDIATSTSLKLSKEIDPLGDRTIGIITKSDLLTREELKNLKNITKQYPLKLGAYCAVSSKKERNITLLKEILQKNLAKKISESTLMSQLSSAAAGAAQRKEISFKNILNEKHSQMSINIDYSKFYSYLIAKQGDEIEATDCINFYYDSILKPALCEMDQDVYGNVKKKIYDIIDNYEVASDLSTILRIWKVELKYRGNDYANKKMEIINNLKNQIRRIRIGIKRMFQLNQRKWIFKQFRKEIQLQKHLHNCIHDCKEEVIEALRKDMMVSCIIQYGNLILHRIGEECKLPDSLLYGNVAIDHWVKGLVMGDKIYKDIMELDRNAIIGEIKEILKELKE